MIGYIVYRERFKDSGGVPFLKWNLMQFLKDDAVKLNFPQSKGYCIYLFTVQ